MRPSNLTSRRSGFTLIEMLVTLTIIAVVVVLVHPMMTSDARLRMEAAVRILVSDIEFAQSMTVGNPEQPVIVRFDPDNHRYWLAFADTPNDPLPRQGSPEPYLVRLGFGRAAMAAGVTFTITGATDDTLEFDGFGSLERISDRPVIRFERDGHWAEIDVSPTTGSITVTGGAD